MSNYLKKRRRELKTKWYKKLRMSVFMRDDFTCQLCGARGGYLNAHHIKRYIDSKSDRFDRCNLITLCADCHDGIFGMEKDYEKMFQRIVRKNEKKWQTSK